MHKPIELAAQVPGVPGARVFAYGECRVIVSHDPVPGGRRWHMSISREDHYPSWDEIRDARYALVPDNVTMAMLLPPKSEYVNVHKNCFHLWETRDIDRFQGVVIAR